jgi:hypothetical protein
MDTIVVVMAERTYPSFVKYGPHAAFQVQPVAPVYSPVPGRDYLKTKRLVRNSV